MSDDPPTVADLVVRCLEAEGVRYVFGVPGEENESLLFALDRSPITFVPTRHEQGAAFMANVWGRLSGEAGVCLATLGPGATNLVTGVADADLDKAPLVAITAQGSFDRLHHESHQILDILHLFEPITRWNATVQRPESVTEIVRKAFRVARSDRPGATHVELPEDIADLPVDDLPEALRTPIRHAAAEPNPAPARAVGAAARAVQEARRPLILVGNGVLRARACEDVTALAVNHDLPVVQTFMGKGAIDDRLAQSLFTVGSGIPGDLSTEAVEAADLILAIGYDVAELPPRAATDGSTAVVHVDVTAAETYADYVPLVEVIGALGPTVRALDAELGARSLSREAGWASPVRERILADLERDRQADDDALTVPGALHVLREVLPDDALVISDVGSHKVWIGRNLPIHDGGDCIVSNGLASMGIALPGGIAASLVQPDRCVVAAMGDGGFLMNVQELETAARLGVGFVVVVFVDDDYGLISWKQRRSRNRSVSTRIGNPDLVKLAESFGIAARRAATPAALRSALRSALDAGTLHLVEVPVDASANDRLVQRLG